MDEKKIHNQTVDTDYQSPSGGNRQPAETHSLPPDNRPPSGTDRFQAWQRMQQTAQTPEQPPNNPDVFPEEPLQPEERKSNVPMIIAIIFAALTVLGAAGFFGYIFLTRAKDAKNTQPATVTTAPSADPTAAETAPFTENGAVKTVTMPDLTGLSEEDAYKQLNEAGVSYKVSREYSDTVAINSVVSQQPEVGAIISKNEQATVIISKGVKDAVIPNPTVPTTSEAPSTEVPSSKPRRESSADDDSYLLPHSNSTYLGTADLENMDRDMLNLALNEIYARHGRKFSDPAISAYFKSKSWYHGTVSAANFNAAVLNEYETYNIDFISTYQQQKGYRS